MGKCEPKINPSTEKSLGAATTTEKSKLIATTVEKLLASVSNASEKCMSFNLPNLDDVNDSVTFTAGNLLTGDGTEWVDLALGTASQLLRVNAGGTAIEWATVSGTGDVTGPGVATDEAIVRFDGTSGKIIQDYTGSAPTISDAGILDMGGNAIDNVSLIDLNVGNAFSINSTDVLDATELKSGVVNSSLTNVGTLTAGTWAATDVAVLHGGTGASTAQAAIDTLTAVSGATNEHVLTKDTGTGNAVFKAATGGGDVTKVGTPVDDEIGVWTGDGTLEGDTNFQWDGAGTTLLVTGSLGTTGARLTKGWFTDLEVTNAIAGSITGNAATVTTITGLAPDTATTQAAQPSITSLGTLTTLTVDDITINGNTISSAGASTLAINPTGGQVITFDSTITLDAGVIAGATSITSTAFVGALTGNADTVTTNANLTGEVTSTGNAAILDVTAISGQTLVTAVATDMVLIEDATDGLLKRADVSDLLAGSGTVTSSGSPLNNEVAVFATATDINSDSTFTWDATTLTVQGTTIDAGGVDIATGDTYAINAIDVLAATALHANVQVPVNSLNSGTSADATTFWRGDGTWVTPSGGGTVTSSGSPLNNEIAVFATATDINSDSTFTWDSVGSVFTVMGTTIDTNGIDVATGDTYAINSVDVLTATVLGSSVVTSSLTSLGTIATGVWEGTTIAVNQGGTGDTTYTNGQLLIGNTTGNTLAKAVLTEGNGITVTNGTGTITVAADVASTGTPASNYVAHFTDANTVTGANTLVWDDTDLFIRNTANDGNPSVRIGNDSVNELHIEMLYHTGFNTLSTVNMLARSSSATADAGRFLFTVDDTARFIIDDGGANMPTGNTYNINDIPVISDSGLGSSVVSSSLTSVGTVTSGVWEGTEVDVANGGSGRTSAIAYSVLCGGVTTSADHQSVAALGSSGQVLTSGGAGALPTWTTPAGSGTVTSSGSPLINEIAVFATATDINSDSTFSWDGTTFTATDTTIDAGGVDVATGDTYAINSVDMLTVDTLGSTVLTSSLTTVGTIGTGTWEGSVITDTYLQDTSLTQQGVVELATTAEIETGTDTTRAIPVDQFVASDRNIRFINLRVVEADTNCAVDTTVGGDFECPFTGTIIQDDTNTSYFCAYNDTAGITSEMIVDVHVAGATIMATNKLDIETTEKSSSTATTQPVVSDAPITAGEIITIDIDQIHSGTAAKGLTVRIPIRLT